MTTLVDYCPKCDLITEHRETTDEILGHALECLVCHIIWEADVTEQEETEETTMAKRTRTIKLPRSVKRLFPQVEVAVDATSPLKCQSVLRIV